MQRAVAKARVTITAALPWFTDDYVAAEGHIHNPEDHWATDNKATLTSDPIVGEVSGLEPQYCTPMVDLLAGVVSPSDPARSKPQVPSIQLRFVGLDAQEPQQSFDYEGPSHTGRPDADWFGDTVSPFEWSTADYETESDLPFFDEHATSALSIAGIFDQPHALRTNKQATLLAYETSIIDPDGRDRAARLFRDAFDEQRWPGLFKAWLKLAPSVSCASTLVLTFELRELWDDSPHLWRYHNSPGRPSKQHQSAQQQMSWRRALAIAEAADGRPGWQLFDEDLVGEWEALDEPCPGFWSLGEYFEIAATGDAGTAYLYAALARQGHAKGALYLQEQCERLDAREGSSRFRPGVGAVLDGEIAGFHHRLGYLEPRLNHNQKATAVTRATPERKLAASLS